MKQKSIRFNLSYLKIYWRKYSILILTCEWMMWVLYFDMVGSTLNNGSIFLKVSPGNVVFASGDCIELIHHLLLLDFEHLCGLFLLCIDILKELFHLLNGLLSHNGIITELFRQLISKLVTFLRYKGFELTLLNLSITVGVYIFKNLVDEVARLCAIDGVWIFCGIWVSHVEESECFEMGIDIRLSNLLNRVQLHSESISNEQSDTG